jgi:adenine-specific DNA-methyltransferase
MNPPKDMTSHGQEKTQAIKESQKQSTGTLRPCKKESKNWDTTQNLYIEGDNLEVLKLLYKTYYGKIKMIYIDPPYNTGNDFVYSDNYTDNLEHYLEITGQTTTSEEGGGGKKSIKTTTNPETSGRYHSNWLNMMYPRLKLARNLLTDDGVIFISIDDNEVGNLRKICDEIFGESNFVSCISVEMSLTQGMKVGAAKKGAVVKNGEYILIYSKNNQWTVNNLLYDKVEGYDNHFSIYLEEDSDGTLNMKSIHDLIVSSDYLKNIFNKYNLQYDFKSFRHLINISDDFREYVYKKLSNNLHQSMMAKINVPSEIQNQLNEGKVVRYDKYILYQVNSGKIRQLLPLSATIGATDDYKPIFGRRRIRGDFWKEFYKDMMNISKEGNVTFKNGKKPIRLIKQLIKWSSNTSDIVLDFFSGSATTAHAVMKLNSEDNVNRRFILVQIPESMEENSDSNKEEKELETICEIGKERIRRAGEKILEESCNKDLDVGFKVFKLDSSNLKKWDPDYKQP